MAGLTTPPPVDRIRGSENQALKWLFGFSSCIGSDAFDKLHRRLSTIPGDWRDARMIQTRLDNLIDRLCETIPNDQKGAILRNLMNQEICIRVPSYASEPSYTLVPLESCNVLAQAAMDSQCNFCSKTAAEAHACPLRKALDKFTTLDREEIEGCRYRAGTMDRDFLEEDV